MRPSTTEQLYNFTTLIGKLKKLERFKGQYYWKDYPTLTRYESVADHTWRLGMLVLLFSKKLSKPIDEGIALKISLVHDLPEVIAGDLSPMGNDGTGNNTYAYDDSKKKDKFQNEIEAAKKLFSSLSKSDSKELYDLWLEYEKQESFESKVVKALDKLECLLQVLEYRDGNMFKEHLDFSIDYGTKYADVDPSIKDYAKYISELLRKKFIKYK